MLEYEKIVLESVKFSNLISKCLSSTVSEIFLKNNTTNNKKVVFLGALIWMRGFLSRVPAEVVLCFLQGLWSRYFKIIPKDHGINLLLMVFGKMDVVQDEINI